MLSSSFAIEVSCVTCIVGSQSMKGPSPTIDGDVTVTDPPCRLVFFRFGGFLSLVVLLVDSLGWVEFGSVFGWSIIPSALVVVVVGADGVVVVGMLTAGLILLLRSGVRSVLCRMPGDLEVGAFSRTEGDWRSGVFSVL
jgi:hypothetical protein